MAKTRIVKMTEMAATIVVGVTITVMVIVVAHLIF